MNRYSQALRCIGNLVLGHPQNLDVLASKVLGEEPHAIPALNSILRIVLWPTCLQEFLAAQYVLKCFCEVVSCYIHDPFGFYYQILHVLHCSVGKFSLWMSDHALGSFLDFVLFYCYFIKDHYKLTKKKKEKKRACFVSLSLFSLP